MITLDPEECRVLGVLVEKAHTTPAQYPLTLNALITGCNQRNNRDPVTDLTEEEVLAALDSLRAKGLVREAMLSGSRVEKYRHVAREGLEVGTSELVLLVELLLRGPQTVGELRGRASRMHPLDSIETTTAVLDHLAKRDPPLVRELAPAPGTRAGRFAQLLCPTLHRLDAPAPHGSIAAPRLQAVGAAGAGAGRLEERIERLEREVGTLRGLVSRLCASLGEPMAGSAAPES